MEVLRIRCPSCGHASPARGPRLRGSTMVECELCRRTFVVTDEQCGAAGTGVRYTGGIWQSTKVS